MAEAAVREHERTGHGRFVNYNQLPDIFWETVLPQDYQVPITDAMVENMKKVAKIYSKGRGNKADQEWKEDSQTQNK